MKSKSASKEFAKYVSQNVFAMIGMSCYILADTLVQIAITIQMHLYLPALPRLPPHRLLFPQRFPKQKRFRRRRKTESGHQMAPTGNLWLTEPPIPDGLPTQMLIDIISTRMGSCRPAGSPWVKNVIIWTKTESCRPEPSP